MQQSSESDIDTSYINTAYFASAGWKIERQLDSIHCTLLPSHTLESADHFISQLQEACTTAKVNHQIPWPV